MNRRADRSIAWDDGGFSLVEMLIAVGVMLAVTGGIFAVMSPARATFQAQPELSDMQQRLRVATDALYKDLLLAGAGSDLGSHTGPLVGFFAPVLPFRRGYVGGDAPGTFRTGTITILYVPPNASQTTLSEPMAAQSGDASVNLDAGCPSGDVSCGFTRSTNVIIYDDTGSYDLFTVTSVQTNQLTLRHDQIDSSKSYDAGTKIAQVASVTYWLNPATNQLMHYDGSQSDVPVADAVVSLSFEYYGEAAPGSPLVRLDPSMLTDGPWRPDPTDPNRWDGDLLRVRTIVATVRVQSAVAALRGRDALLFRNPGTASSANRMLPDQEITFEVAPRNLNIGR